MTAIVGLDVGGAHLKLARLGAEGRLEAVRIAACPLWKGLDRLEAALDEIAADIPAAAACVATMTGELVDLWPDRAAGVGAIAEALAARFGAGRLMIYAGAAGFIAAAAAGAHVDQVASANWRATAEALARTRDAGLLVDVGSTTSDLIPFAGGGVLARGATDAARMAADELVYQGVARTPVMALSTRLPFAGAWVTPMAEHFATSADVHRLTGDLPEGADLHPAADDGPKTPEASARRLLRMVGADLDAATRTDAETLARFLAEAQLRRLHDAALGVLTRPEARSIRTVVGAGAGRFLAKRVAERLGLGYRDLGAAFAETGGLAEAAADCAPAVAVARLWAARGR
ncbi:putative H4MPT-linked C1 transfer pathway protein [Methylopila capsulata]|uniref:ATP synthase subunit C n=1 Tax=Methylopila capsulata TaxID=61654 RepID=A0A9W6IS11_9HYPH|nr:hydantoinase/oxoprolinase family protein [Methylopila capsulata]MBM7849843.1 putative H4MPT-linked C1 transfer pathway protein [Methylopila capsulata]GLK55133.1 ATP synthase subunit C [Methylopila capsulata]